MTARRMPRAQRYERATARRNGREAIRWIGRAAAWPDETRFTIAQAAAVQTARFAWRWALRSVDSAAGKAAR